MGTTPEGIIYPDPADVPRRQDLQTLAESIGTGAFSWASYTPILSNWALGNGTLTGLFLHVGDLVHFEIQFQAGSTTVFDENPVFSLPVDPAVGLASPVIGQAQLLDASNGGNNRAWHVWGDGGGARIRSDDTNRASPTVPFTWASGDIMILTGSYRAAS